MDGKKTAVMVILIVVVVAALIFALKKSGIVGGRATPPNWVLEQPLECIDVNSGELSTKPLQEWRKLGEKDGAYKNPATGQYTMVAAMTCAACGAKIPTPKQPADTAPAVPGTGPKVKSVEPTQKAGMNWALTAKCPKCGQNPFFPPQR